MALIWSEGFDGPQTSTKYVTTGIAIFDTTAGRNGKGARYTGSFQTVMQLRDFSSAEEDDVIIMGIALKYRVAPTVTHDVASFEYGTLAQHLKLRITAAYKIQITDSTNTVIAETPTSVLATGQWYYIELKVKIHDTLGTAEIRTNGLTRVTATNVDTRNNANSAPALVNRVVLYLNQSASLPEVNYMDDIYICNKQGSTMNDFLGDVRIDTLLPNGNGNSSQWVGSDADSVNNYLLVSDTSDATYVESNIDFNKDTYAHANTTNTTGNILGVVQWTRAQVDIVPRQIVPVARLGATEADGVTYDMATSLTWYKQVNETKPGGGTWTFTDVDNAEFGYKVDTA